MMNFSSVSKGYTNLIVSCSNGTRDFGQQDGERE